MLGEQEFGAEAASRVGELKTSGHFFRVFKILVLWGEK